MVDFKNPEVVIVINVIAAFVLGTFIIMYTLNYNQNMYNTNIISTSSYSMCIEDI